jgi:mRNA interferase MazF
MNLQKGEIWLVNFDPTVGSEINKRRPAIIVSSNSIGILPLRIVVPITTWQEKFENSPWLIKIVKDENNNLKNDSTADTFQIKSVSNDRFISKIGNVTNKIMQEIKMGINISIG